MNLGFLDEHDTSAPRGQFQAESQHRANTITHQRDRHAVIREDEVQYGLSAVIDEHLDAAQIWDNDAEEFTYFIPAPLRHRFCIEINERCSEPHPSHVEESDRRFKLQALGHDVWILAELVAVISRKGRPCGDSHVILDVGESLNTRIWSLTSTLAQACDQRTRNLCAPGKGTVARGFSLVGLHTQGSGTFVSLAPQQPPSVSISRGPSADSSTYGIPRRKARSDEKSIEHRTLPTAVGAYQHCQRREFAERPLSDTAQILDLH